jgi:hypothetical protein
MIFRLVIGAINMIIITRFGLKNQIPVVVFSGKLPFESVQNRSMAVE